MPEKLFISKKGEFCDKDGNVVVLRGVNLDPNAKLPAKPDLTSHVSLKNDNFWDLADDVSFVNHPFPLDQVESHINRLKSLGFNHIRFPFTWESIEHKGPEIYDYEFMDYIIEVLKIIDHVGGVYVYLDPHQDVWSRFTGGSGAPYWTLLCAGFQPKRFRRNEAAIVHNTLINTKTGKDNINDFPKMVWATNYYKLACQTMFTLFFGGKHFAPKCMINGMNIQDYLQETFLKAILEFYKRIQERAPELFESNCIIGLESMNEPSHGYIGTTNLNEIEKERNLRLGSTPTGFQSFMLGEGINTTIDRYEITVFGPSKSGTKNVLCEGESAWLTKDERDAADSKYGWSRNEEWTPVICIWRLHKVWKIDQSGPKLLQPDYFSKLHNPGTIAPDLVVNERYFMNNLFTHYFNNFHRAFRHIDKESFVLIQPPVFRSPPHLRHLDIIIGKTICACHFYDGLSLMYKTWSRFFNVDTFGIVRGNYSNPMFSIVLGESRIRDSFQSQLKLMKQEVHEILGKDVPTFFTEIGMPYDMDNKKAYLSGDYTSQTKAMNAIAHALEGNNLSFSLWCYSSGNSHRWGDNWNNEDFSIYSNDDRKDISHETTSRSGTPSLSVKSLISSSSGNTNGSKFITKTTAFDDIKWPPTPPLNDLDFNGFRGTDALVRPFPLKIHGRFIFAKFDLEMKSYALKIHAKASSNASNTTKNATYIFLPKYHFDIDRVDIGTSSGTFLYNEEYQLLKWHHDAGHQSIAITSKNKFNKDDGCIII